MVFLRALLVAIWAVTAPVSAAPSTHSDYPIVTLDSGTFIGTTANGTNKFLGIPFAQPPVGNLRFRLPQALGPYVGKSNATTYGLSCPQQTTTFPIVNGFPQESLDALSRLPGAEITLVDGEDCLYLNVIAPAHARPASNLPVVVWIYGGGYETGSTTLYDGTVIVNRSIALQQPVIYVSMNYRLSAFGFLASQEVKDAGVGNLGLWDRECSDSRIIDIVISDFTERLALRWLQNYICEFGGDPSKVTIWGQSAGAVSAALHMVTNGGNNEGLFRAAFMQSGSTPPSGPTYYDFLVERTNCSGSPDTLACLREAPYDELKAAMDDTPSAFSYQSLALVWLPRVDGVFLVDDPQKLVQQGIVARIPVVSGNCDDEGTLYSLSQLNVTTDAELRTYLLEFFLSGLPDAQMDELLTLYPQNVSLGSPYDTGTQNALTPESKRIASIIGDLVFQTPRRFFVQPYRTSRTLGRSVRCIAFALMYARKSSSPHLPACRFSRSEQAHEVSAHPWLVHQSDLPNIYGGGDLTDFLIRFATNLDPNGVLSPEWPRYTPSSPRLMTFLGNQFSNDNRTITQDTYRVQG
ncbi:Alpha/Beta hydrolase protein [Lactarius quietus]|nr:Alpha/Beta hydrolase protein [Lactarius quietus]